jgi:hypothetical protein
MRNLRLKILVFFLLVGGNLYAQNIRIVGDTLVFVNFTAPTTTDTTVIFDIINGTLFLNGVQVTGVWSSGSAQDIYYNASGRPQVGIGLTTPTAGIHVVDSVGSNAATFSSTSVSSGVKVILEATGSGATGATLQFDHSATSSPGDNDSIGLLQYIGRDDASSTDVIYAHIQTATADVSNGSESGQMVFSINHNNSFDQILRLDGEEGSVTINEAGGDIDFIVEDDNSFNAFTVQGSDGGVVVGNPTDFSNGAGTLNAEAIYDDGAQITPDYVFEEDYEYLNISETEQFYKERKHLPTLRGRKEWEEKRPSIGEMASMLWETVEIQQLYISKLNKKITELEAKMATIEAIH